MIHRRIFSRSAGGLVLAAGSVGTVRADTPRSHRLVIHVGGPEPLLMNVALHNIINAIDAYQAQKEAIAVELVANGPGYTMLRADRSPVAALIAQVKTKYPFVVFSACQNSRAGMAAAEGKSPSEIPELPEATDVPAGIVRLIDLQEQGWTYVRV